MRDTDKQHTALEPANAHDGSETIGTPIIQDMLFREEAVFEELKSLKACKSHGSDEIPAKLPLELSRELAKPRSFL
ncbi:unnamed protein product [Schistocephalus solidus]|uniref:Reverse transcriptase n=1 Tax=Schistocephalus solidus TaxID=70667 RepID=A0A183SBT4_SCHSO|nr:unnamed protein product [Schistocephalus solidus]